MRIGIDARAAAEEPGGRGRYVRELLRALDALDTQHSYRLYARERWAAEELGERFEWALVDAGDPLWHLRVARRASRECDFYFSTNSYLTLWFLRVPGAAVVFDMVAFEPGTRARRRSQWIEWATLRPAIRRAAALTAISESTRRDLVRRFPAAAAKTKVIPLAADPAFRPDGANDGDVLARHGVDGAYVLAIGTLEPRKNLPRLIEAFAALDREARGERRLVLVGATGWDTDETFASIAAHRDSVTTLGYVPDDDLPALYRQADVFCYPSLYEGFGLPVLEAMACGTSVITSSVSSLPEVGGDAVVYVDPLDVGALRRTLADLLADPERRRELSRRGYEAARAFSWERTARETLALIESAAER